MKSLLNQVVNQLNDNHVEVYALFDTASLLNNKKSLSKINTIGIHDKYYWKVRQLLSFLITDIKRKKLILSNNEESVIIHFFKAINTKTIIYDYTKHRISQENTVEIKLIAKENILKTKSKKRFFNNINVPNSGVFYNRHDLFFDREYRQVTVIIPTMYRQEKVLDLMYSLYLCEDERVYQFYIGDQSKETNEVIKYFISKAHHRYIKVNYNAGLSQTRNQLIELCHTPYVFICDDDTVFKSSPVFSKLESVLLERADIGICGGQFSNRFPYLDIIRDRDCFEYLIKNKSYLFSKNGTQYCLVNCIANFFLAKVKLFEQNKWREELKLGEHIPFFLDLEKSPWNVAYTPDVFCEHNQKLDKQEYGIHHTQNKKDCYQLYYNSEHITYTITKDLRKNTMNKLKYAVIPWDKIEVYETIKKWDEERYNHYFNYFSDCDNIVINLNQSETKQYFFKNFKTYDCKSNEDFISILQEEEIDFIFTWNCETNKIDKCIEVCKQLDIPLIAMPVSTHNLRLDSLNRCDLVICISDAVKNVCKETVPENKLEIIPIGLSPKKFYPLNMDNQEIFTVATFGRGKTPSKNWYNTAKALQLVSKQQKIKWIVAGSKTDTIIDFKTNKSYSLFDFSNENLIIDYRGVLSQEEINQAYNEADIFLLASIYEGQGLVWFESWLTHTPVATSNLPPMQNYIKEGKNGELFDPNSVLSIYRTILKMMKNIESYKLCDYDKSVKGFTVPDVLEQRAKIFEKHLLKYQWKEKKNIPKPTKETAIIDNYNYAIKKINSLNLPICLLKTTCYDAVKYGKFTTDLKNIYLGVPADVPDINQDAPHQSIKIHILPYPRKTKIWGKWYHSTQVVYPVIPYLNKIEKEISHAHFKSR